jgi:glycosyltransferase involved in cell wall biosynthesis
MAPRVSIGMPVFNGERFLAQSLQSLLAQDFADFELIISDTASTDGTRGICEEFARSDDRIRYCRSEANPGAAANFNRVFELSDGELFRWAAHDDLVAPSHLRRCVETMGDAPGDVVLVYPETICIDENGDVLREYPDELETPFPKAWLRLRHLMRHLHEPNLLFGLFRANALRRTRLMGGYYAADYVLLSELSMLGQFRKVREPLFYRRMHPGICARANPRPTQQAAWFAGSRGRRAVLPYCRLFTERLRAVRHVGLSPGERLQCYLPVLEEVLRRSGKRMVKEILAAAMPTGRQDG